MDKDFRWPEMMDILYSQKGFTLSAKDRGNFPVKINCYIIRMVESGSQNMM